MLSIFVTDLAVFQKMSNDKQLNQTQKLQCVNRLSLVLADWPIFNNKHMDHAGLGT